MSLGVEREFIGLGDLGNIGIAVGISFLSVLQSELSLHSLWKTCGSFPLPVWKSWFSERVIGYKYHNIVFWEIKIVKLVRNSACIPLLPFIESMALIFLHISVNGGREKPFQHKLCKEVRIILTEND
jgi:hypothetical protein